MAALSGCGGGESNETPPPPEVVVPPPTPQPDGILSWLTADAIIGEQQCPIDQAGYRIYLLVEGVAQAPIMVPFNAAQCRERGIGSCGQVWECAYTVPAGNYQITSYDSAGIESVPSPVIAVQ